MEFYIGDALTRDKEWVEFQLDKKNSVQRRYHKNNTKLTYIIFHSTRLFLATFQIYFGSPEIATFFLVFRAVQGYQVFFVPALS